MAVGCLFIWIVLLFCASRCSSSFLDSGITRCARSTNIAVPGVDVAAVRSYCCHLVRVTSAFWMCLQSLGGETHRGRFFSPKDAVFVCPRYVTPFPAVAVTVPR